MSEVEGKRHHEQPREPDQFILSPKNDATALTPRQAGLIVALGVAFGVGVIYEWAPLNGIASLTRWEWPWQDLGTFRIGLALLAPLLLIAGIVARPDRTVSFVPRWLSVGGLVLANFCLQLFSVLADRRGLSRIPRIVASANATSYFTDALSIKHVTEWLSHFHQASLQAHSATHPAGPILFYYFFARLFGSDVGALIGGCAVGLLASFGVALMYNFAGLWTMDDRVRLVASAFYALLPGLIAFFPEFDQVYPIFSMLIIVAFVRALSAPAKSYRFAVALGAAVFVATFFAYNLLTIGMFVVCYGLYWLRREGAKRWAVFTLLRTTVIALGVSVLLYLMLWAVTGYNAPAAFRHALTIQAEDARKLGRPYLIFVLMDLYDFALAAGIIAVAILWFHVRKLSQEIKANPNGTALTLIALATVLTVDLSGLLRGETARVWLFLQPLLVVPVAIELVRLRWPWRLGIFAVQWWILVCIKAKMSFIEP